MADQSKARDVNDAAQRFAEILADSYRTVYDQAEGSRESQERLAQEFSDQVSDALKQQGERARDAAEGLAEQGRAQRETASGFARESADAYLGFLQTALSYQRASADEATRSAQEGTRAVTDAATGLVGTATGAAGAAAGSPAFPLAGYDEMNVDEASKALNDLSVEELRVVRDYEERNKNRESLLEQMDRKIRSA